MKVCSIIKDVTHKSPGSGGAKACGEETKAVPTWDHRLYIEAI